MNTQIAQKLTQLKQIIIGNYVLRGDAHAETAGQFQLDIVINLIKGQPQYAEQLLDEEIKDCLKARLTINKLQ